jgi:diguanylate cyclase (GGDEF)-like protein
VLVVALVGFVGGVDWLTGPQISTSILYMVPVGLAAARGSRFAALGVAFVCASFWLILDLSEGRDYAHAAIPYWNGAVRLGIFVTVAVLVDRNRQLQAAERALARTDPLTGVSNSRAFREALEQEATRSRRMHRPLSLAYVDLDNFKAVNDQHGHEVGDRVLRIVADTLRGEVRAIDVVARLGGDEFAVMLVEAEAQQAHVVLERVRAKIFEAMQQGAWPVTASIGVATFTRIPEESSTMLRDVDALMYGAKRSGKDRIVVAASDAGSGEAQ